MKSVYLAQPLVRYGLALAFLAVPAVLTAALKSHPALNPIISLSFVTAVSAAAWWCGAWGGILASVAATPVLVFAATGGKAFLPAHFDPLGLFIFCFISVLVSRVANTRKRIEQILRSANAQLETRVQERTAALEQANTAIQHQLAELESLYTQLPAGICFLDGNLRFLRINETLAKINGASAKAHLGRELREMIPQQMADILEPLYHRSLVTGEPVLDFELADPSSEDVYQRRTWMLNCSPVAIGNGTVLGLQVVVQDITERKRSEYALYQAHEELKNREEQFRTLANAIPQLSWTTDGSGSVLWCNDRWIAYTGTSMEQMKGEGWHSIHDPALLPAIFDKWQTSLATGEPFEMEFPIRAFNGHFGWFLARAIPLRDGTGRPVRWFGTATDIDELKRSREALIESEARFRTMANSAPVMIWMSGPDKILTWSNKRWLDFTGYSTAYSIDQESGDEWSSGIHTDDHGRCVETYVNCFNARKEFVLEYRRKRRDGKWRWVLEHGIPRIGGNNDFLGYIASCVDIHDRKEMEEDLRRANSDLQQFAYSASHDLQEPIRTVAIYSQLVAKRYEPKLDETGRTFLEYLTSSAKRLEKLVHDLLLYTQAARTELSVSETIDAGAALKDAVANLSASIVETGAEVSSDPLPAVRAQSVHLQQLFQNLVGNGIKYAGEKQPRIHVSAVRQNAYWLFSVQDNGIGIDPAYRERVFGIFKRLHTADQYSGTGIGLAICQRIVERYRGRIWVESELGKGATFFFTIPV